MLLEQVATAAATLLLGDETKVLPDVVLAAVVATTDKVLLTHPAREDADEIDYWRGKERKRRRCQSL